jgi:hypothetical protein
MKAGGRPGRYRGRWQRLDEVDLLNQARVAAVGEREPCDHNTSAACRRIRA